MTCFTHICALFFGLLNLVFGSPFEKVGIESPENDFAFPSSQTSNQPNLRIVGGTKATAHQFPYQVGMYVTTYANAINFCGGSLISKNYVLTAAHCVEKVKSIEIILGAQDITTNEEDQVKLYSTNYTIHSGWNLSTLLNDIALVALPESVNVSSKINVVELATGNNSFADDNGTVAGWGHTYDNDVTISPNLLYITNNIMNNTECQAVSTSYETVIKSTHMCLSGENEKSICQGDSGGPLVSENLQVGIVSFGWKSCEQSKPSVFTRITEYTDWIQKNSDVILS